MIALKQKLLAYLLCLAFFSSIASFPSLANAAGTSMQGYDRSYAEVPYAETEELRYFGMIGDLLIARPLLLAATVLGTGMFLISLPFSALGGNAKEAANTLVVSPAWETFIRCLGCRMSALRSDQYINTRREQRPSKEGAPHVHTKIKPSEATISKD
jgi:hypothetical protein